MRYVPLTGYLERGQQRWYHPRTGWFVHAERQNVDDVPAVVLTGPSWFIRLLRRLF